MMIEPIGSTARLTAAFTAASKLVMSAEVCLWSTCEYALPPGGIVPARRPSV